MPLPLYAAKRAPRYVVAIAAGKGGVGKSTVAVNLALALKELGKQVGILDADVYGPSIRHMLREDQMPIQQGDRFVPALCQGIRMMSIAYFRDEYEASAVRAPIANGFIGQFLNQVEWGPLDFLLIDFPPGTGDIQLTLAQKGNLTGAIMVTSPQEVALIDVRKAIHLFRQVNVPILGVVENMSYYETHGERVFLFGQGGGEKLARENKIPLLGQIPIEPVVGRCGDLGEPLFYADVTESVLEPWRHLAQQVVHSVEHHVTSFLIPKQIRQKDSHTLQIEWSEDCCVDYRLSDLQKQCSCAQCATTVANVDDDVRAVKVVGVGRYGIRIHFTNGCSAGIFSFDQLYAMKEKS